MSEGGKKVIIDGIEYIKDEYGILRSYNKNRKYHSFNDKPAIIYPNGSKYWYKNGNLHRGDDQPAIIYPDGTKHWCINGKHHRNNDKPAIIGSSGTKRWYVNGIQQPDKYYACVYIKNNEQRKQFFGAELQAKRREGQILAEGLCAWVIEND